ERQVEEERRLLLAVDKADRFAGQDIRQVAVQLDLLPAAIDRSPALVLALHIAVRARQEAKELAEAPVERVKLVLFPQLPFAQEGRGVAGVLEPLGNRHLGHRQALPCATLMQELRVEFVPEALLIPAGKQTSPRGAAVRTGDVAARAADAVPGDAVDVGRG